MKLKEKKTRESAAEKQIGNDIYKITNTFKYNTKRFGWAQLKGRF